MDHATMQAYIRILKEELVCASGCTEPISIAYAAAYARDLLGKLPDRVSVSVSGNILKNVKGVVVPNSGSRKGIPAAVATGIVAGKTERLLEVIAKVEPQQLQQVGMFLEQVPIQVTCLPPERAFDIHLTVYCGEESAAVRIVNHHTNVVYTAKNGQTLTELPFSDSSEENLQDKSVLNFKDIMDFADTVDLTMLKETLDRQICCNSTIAQAGLESDFGANIGKMLLENRSVGIATEARAYAAAGSDARMSGCELPVVILSGSGNQGMAASLPVIRYAKHINATKEQLLRALIVADLIAIYQKAGVGRLSAFCGAVCAGCGAGAGVAYLTGGSREMIARTIQNALAIAPGMICEGAKSSCAAKIAVAVDAGLLGYRMSLQQRDFDSGDGILQEDVDETIRCIGKIASEGMHETDQVILNIMCP